MAFATPALLVHMGLPLFLIAGTIAASINVFFRAVGWAQLLIKRGTNSAIRCDRYRRGCSRVYPSYRRAGHKLFHSEIAQFTAGKRLSG
jgi:hypothetical protein